jgi:ribosomal protein S12 methylthiotransferase accessory factor YcaO
LFSEPSQFGLHLKSRRKRSTDSEYDLTRSKSIQETLAEIEPLCTKIGVTRISNITFLDRLYIPNYSAVLPGTEDIFWVYSGKGPTRASAKASALMEAIERFSSLSSISPRKFIQGTYSQLSKSYKILHPEEVVEPVNEEYDEKHSILDYLPGFDLLRNETVLVPTELALYRYRPKYPAIPAFSTSHTNGLASGNVIEEAICHALCEVIERDAVSLADLCASAIPYNIVLSILESLDGEKSGLSVSRLSIEDQFVDDSSIFPDVNISEIAEDFIPIKRLLGRFIHAGISLMVKDITQKDIGIPSFVASSIEWITQDYGLFARGYGTHPDSRVALIRAITEVSQTRAVNIHGARDDLKKVRYKMEDEIYTRKWQFIPASAPPAASNNKFSNIINFSEIRTHFNDDILDDIRLVLSRLQKAGAKRAIIVDLTNPNIGIPVVRAIVPGLETFEVQNSIMGRRAWDLWRQHFSSDSMRTERGY